MQKLEVTNKGFLCLIQDRGRFGVGHSGLSQGGALDLHSFYWANKLLNNSPTDSLIEITMGGASFTALTNLTLAITGAEMSATIDNSPIHNWQSFHLPKGQTLHFDYAKNGLRSYLAVKNGFNTPTIFNSQSTVTRNELGGIAKKGSSFGTGIPLNNCDIIPINPNNENNQNLISHNQVPIRFQKQYQNHIKLDVIESYQSALFTKESKNTFYQNRYKVNSQSDRMGIYLNGEPIRHKLKDIISEGIAAGSVQIPPNGQPIILLNDRQTLGGYSKIGCISRLSQNKLAQARPNDTVEFSPISLQAATAQWLEFLIFFN